MATFEGTIPKGQYGGRHSQRWDVAIGEPEGNEGPEQALAKAIYVYLEVRAGAWRICTGPKATIGNGANAKLAPINTAPTMPYLRAVACGREAE